MRIYVHLIQPILSARSQIASLTRNKIYVSREALFQFCESIACKYFSPRRFDFYALVLCQKTSLDVEETTKKTINRRRFLDVSGMLNQISAERSPIFVVQF